MDPICERPDCRRPIEDPAEQTEKKFLIVTTGKVVLLRRHDACAEKYGSDAVRRITDAEATRLLSPAETRRRGIERRRASVAAVPSAFRPEDFRRLMS